MTDPANQIACVGELSDDGILGSRNPYEILSVKVSDTAAVIRNAYRSLAIRFRPDRHPPPQHEAAGENVSE